MVIDFEEVPATSIFRTAKRGSRLLTNDNHLWNFTIWNLQADKLPFLWSFWNLKLPILYWAFPYVWGIFDVLCVLKVGCNTNFSGWFFIIHGNFSCFNDIADGCHRTRDIWTQTVARKSQNLSGDTHVYAVQLRVGRNNSCYKTLKNIPFVIFRFIKPIVFLGINTGKSVYVKNNCRSVVFIGLTMTTCFGRVWPSL